jgi:hypothetical protein
MIYFIDLILLAALDSGVYSITNRNEYYKQKKNIFLGSRARPARKADNPTAICKSIVYTMWDFQHLTILLASIACYEDSFAFTEVNI